MNQPPNKNMSRPVRRSAALSRWLCALPLVASAGALQANSLSEVALKVLNEHPDIQSAEALFRVAENVVREARSNFFPTVGIQHELNNTEFTRSQIFGQTPTAQETTTNRTDAVFRWNLFNGLADWYSYRSTSNDRAAAEQDMQEAMERVTLVVTEAYVEVLRLEEQLAHASAYVDDLKILAKDVDTNAAAGRVAQADIDQAQSRYIRAANELSQQRANYNVAVVTFRQLTGLEPKDLHTPTLDMKDSAQPLEELLNRAAASNHRYRAARERIEARDEAIGVATADFMPKVDLDFRYLINLDGNPPQFTVTDRSTQVMMSYLQPIGGRQYYRRSELTERKNAAQADADSIALKLRTDLGGFLRQLTQLRQIAPDLKNYEEATGRVVGAYRLQYDAGRRTLFDLLSVREEFYQSQTARTANLYGQLVVLARMEQLLGGLRHLLGIQQGGDDPNPGSSSEG